MLGSQETQSDIVLHDINRFVVGDCMLVVIHTLHKSVPGDTPRSKNVLKVNVTKNMPNGFVRPKPP